MSENEIEQQRLDRKELRKKTRKSAKLLKKSVEAEERGDFKECINLLIQVNALNSEITELSKKLKNINERGSR